ncbi:MAG TPA: hypothetical protein VJ440_03080 [Candidatus Brocadiaceae bacterium]|nr:hypothetical protein [Candidatus Brocadiaceae bacterium]
MAKRIEPLKFNELRFEACGIKGCLQSPVCSLNPPLRTVVERRGSSLYIDDVHIYNRVLTEQEINAIIQEPFG